MKEEYSITDEGVKQIIDSNGQNYSREVISKDAFIGAYNKYILNKDDIVTDKGYLELTMRRYKSIQKSLTEFLDKITSSPTTIKLEFAEVKKDIEIQLLNINAYISALKDVIEK